jgi:ribosomal protein L3
MGAGQKEARNVSKPMLGHFAGAEVSPKRWVAEFKVKSEEGLGVRVGETVGAGWFSVGQWVDVRGINRGMGFAGVSPPYTHHMEWKNFGLTKTIGHETPRLQRSTRLSRTIAHASRHGIRWWFAGFRIACSAWKAHGRKHG